MNGTLLEVSAGVQRIMTPNSGQPADPAHDITRKRNPSPVAPNSNAVEAVANRLPPKRRKHGARRSKVEPEQGPIAQSDVQCIMVEYRALQREYLDQHDAKAPQLIAANQALLAEKVQAMQQQRHELLQAAQHEAGTAAGQPDSALVGPEVEAQTQQDALQAAAAAVASVSQQRTAEGGTSRQPECCTPMDDDCTSDASGDEPEASDMDWQQSNAPAAAAERKQKTSSRPSRPYFAKYAVRKHAEGEWVQHPPVQAVHLDYVSKAPDYFGWIQLARNQVALDMPPGTKLFYPDNDGESIPIKDPDIEQKPWFDEHGYTHDYALKKLSQAYHDRLGWLLKVLEAGLMQKKADASDDESEGQPPLYKVSCADLADRLIYLWEQDHKPTAPTDWDRQLVSAAGKATGVLYDKWCHRCGGFGCPHHGGAHVLPNKQRMLQLAGGDESMEPCSDSCWRSPLLLNTSAAARQTARAAHAAGDTTAAASGAQATSQQGGSHSGPLSAERVNTQQHEMQQGAMGPPAVQAPHLTCFEEEVLQDGLDTFGPDPCKLALLFQERTCSELHLLLQQRGLLGQQQQSVQDDDAADVSAAAAAFKRRRKRGGASKPTAAYKHVNSMRWQNGGEFQAPHLSYTPCNCTGPCQKGSCSCIDSANFCEKFCACASCKGRRDCTYQGCNCTTGCRITTCTCAKLWRECDPELCRKCSHTLAGTAAPDNCCNNMNIRLNRGKRVHVGLSKVAGWGCFIGEPAHKGDFIGEYVAELFTQEEADRRGAAYDKADNSYLFTINKDFVLDARQAGNKLRFANHSQRPNCVTRVMLVDGDHRVGLYADQDLAAGDELSYNYMYALNNAPDWGVAG